MDDLQIFSAFFLLFLDLALQCAAFHKQSATGHNSKWDDCGNFIIFLCIPYICTNINYWAGIVCCIWFPTIMTHSCKRFNGWKLEITDENEALVCVWERERGREGFSLVRCSCRVLYDQIAWIQSLSLFFGIEVEFQHKDGRVHCLCFNSRGALLLSEGVC